MTNKNSVEYGTRHEMHMTNWMSLMGSLVGLAAVILWRVREGRTPVSISKIIMPPLGMATGFTMFVLPSFRIPCSWAAAAFAIGSLVLAYPLLRTSRLAQQGDSVIMQRSSAFFVMILLLAAVRILARSYFDTFLSAKQTAGLFFVLAFGMIVRWRTQMLTEYYRLIKTSPPTRAIDIRSSADDPALI